MTRPYAMGISSTVAVLIAVLASLARAGDWDYQGDSNGRLDDWYAPAAHWLVVHAFPSRAL